MWQQHQVYLRHLSSQQDQQQTVHPGIISSNGCAHQHHQHQYHHQHQQHHRDTNIMPPPRDHEISLEFDKQHAQVARITSNPRTSRNLAEKQRRDNLNTNIMAMGQLLPMTVGSRKMDKISTLRLAAAFLRAQYTLGRGSTSASVSLSPRQLKDFDLEQYLVEQVVGNGGFFIVTNVLGKIVYISRQVEQHLGHAQNELLGQSLFNYVHPDDHEELRRNLVPDGMRVTMTPTGITFVYDVPISDNSPSTSEDSTSSKTEWIKFFREQRRSFQIRMSQRTVSRRESAQYESLDISGILRLAEACKNTEFNGNGGKHQELKDTSNDIIFVGIVNLPMKRPITELSIMDANKDEYVTRHLIDGRIIYCDHRVSVVAGYMSEEVSGLSAFAFMHKDDYKWTMIGLQQMYSRAVTCGSSCYRLIAKNGEFIYLRTHGYLEFDNDTQTFESFVCINTLVSKEEGIELIKEMKQRFSATVDASASKYFIQYADNSALELEAAVAASQSAECSLEEPSRLEDAITHLVSDIPTPAMSEGSFSPAPIANTQYVKAALISSRLPPASMQANKVGINKIEHYVALQSKGKQSPNIKEEYEDRPSCSGKSINSSDSEQDRLSDSENAKPVGKSLSMYNMMNPVCDSNVHSSDNVPLQSNMYAVHECGNSPCNVVSSSLSPHTNVSSSRHTSILDVRKTALNVNDIKVEPGLDRYDYNQDQVLYYDNTTTDDPVVSPPNDSHSRCTLKRICSDENIVAMRNKKRSNDAYKTTNGNSEHQQQNVSYENCKSFVGENSTLTVGYNWYPNGNSQSLLAATESPSSSLYEVGTDYQQLPGDHSTAPLLLTSTEEDQFGNLEDETLLSPNLEPNSEITMNIFDNLRPVTNIENSFNERQMQQLAPDDPTVNNKIKQTYRHLENNMSLCESQLNVLAHDMKNPALCTRRGNLSQLQTEHSVQKQMLGTLQQDHRKIQVNVKHTAGI